ncbi:hypothetical protein ACFRA2_31190, partial [Streptomyces cyaneofuscatus]
MLIIVGVLGVAAGLAALLEDGWASQAVISKRSVIESPGYVVLLAISGLWTAASSGSPVYLRVLGGVFGAFCVVGLAVDFVKERRRYGGDSP